MIDLCAISISRMLANLDSASFYATNSRGMEVIERGIFPGLVPCLKIAI